MKTEVIVRKTKEKYEEESPSGAIFLYDKFLGRIILKLATKRFVSKIAGIYMNSKLSTRHIEGFIKSNRIDMSDYKVQEYKSFNDFFSREIKADKRKFSKEEVDLISPADSKLLVYEINSQSIFKIKEKNYTLQEILRDRELAEQYKKGLFLVFRLSVDDYHRYCFIDDGHVLKSKKINGLFHTVGPIAFKQHKVFQENQREYQLLETKNFGNVIQMEVGALMVGKIANNGKTTFKKGEEKGMFLFGGSTIVLMFENNKVEIDEDILINSKKHIETKIKQGETIGKKLVKRR